MLPVVLFFIQSLIMPGQVLPHRKKALRSNWRQETPVQNDAAAACRSRGFHLRPCRHERPQFLPLLLLQCYFSGIFFSGNRIGRTCPGALFCFSFSRGIRLTCPDRLCIFSAAVGQPFLKKAQGLSPESIDGAHRQEYAVIRCHVQIPKGEEGVLGLSKPGLQLFPVEGTAAGRLDDCSHSFCPHLSCSHFECGWFTGSERSFSLDLYRGKAGQKRSADLLLQGGVRPGIAGFPDRNEFSAVSLMIIPRPEIRADIEGAQLLQVFPFHLPGPGSSRFHPGIAPVDILAVNGCDPCGIDRFFHSAFDLKRMDPGIDQLGKD